MDRYIVLVETTPELWEMAQDETKRNTDPDYRSVIGRTISRKGFTLMEHDFAFTPAVLLNQAKNLMSHDGSRQARFQLQDFWLTIKGNFYPYRQIDTFLNTDKQFLVFYTVFDVQALNEYVEKAVDYRRAMGYNDKVEVCRIRLSHDGSEQLTKWHDYLITCSGDWKLLKEDLKLALEDYIEHDVFLEPRNQKPQAIKVEDDMEEILEKTSWYKPQPFFNPFAQGWDWRGIEYPPPKQGDIYWMKTSYEI